MSEYSLKTLKEHIIQLDVNEKAILFNQSKIDELNKVISNHQNEIAKHQLKSLKSWNVSVPKKIKNFQLWYPKTF